VSGWRPEITELVGRFVHASNATLLARAGDDGLVVYKPTAGERPLWDFPEDSLAAREVLTYEVSQIMGLGVVPETVLAEGPAGPGSVQRFVDLDEEFDPVPLINGVDPALWPIAVLDVVCNNADRKVGHVLRASSGRLFGIDHGLTFHSEDKLRTVLWGFAGVPLPDDMVAAVARLRTEMEGEFARRVASLVGDAEMHALTARARELLADRRHPEPPDDRPAIPWPPY
jgi:uncharacterized repeat protein (TIGR03843 family)